MPSPTQPPYRVALTGGIASGKSTVADLFAARGVPVIDTDVIAREVVEPGQPALAAIVDAFGPGVLDADGRLDRPRLREMIFSDPAARRRLEAILHPAIRQAMERQSQAAAALGSLPGPRDSPAGRGRANRPRRPGAGGRRPRNPAGRAPGRARQGLARTTLRRHCEPRPRARRRLAIADDVIENTGSIADLQAQVAALHERYVDLARRKPERRRP